MEGIKEMEEMEETKIEEIELNDEWINNFEKTDKLYQEFYKDNIYYVNLKFIYINRNNEIEKINKESFLMSKPNFILREEIIQILKMSSINNYKRYSLLYGWGEGSFYCPLPH